MPSATFLDERLDEHLSYGFVGGPTFVTTVQSLFSGWDRRNAERLRPMYRYRALYERITFGLRDKLQTTYIVARGQHRAFRFKDWADYRISNAIIGAATGDPNEQMQIIKPYTFAGETVERIITKPADASRFTIANGYVADAIPLAVTEDTGGGAVPLAHVCDYSTGMLTFTASAPGAVIRVTCDFDVPVRFEHDEAEFDFVNWDAHSTELRLKEDFAS